MAATTTDSYALVENPVTMRAASSELYPLAAIPIIQPRTPNREEKTKTGRFPNFVAKADTNGLTNTVVFEIGGPFPHHEIFPHRGT
jgi:hypothetical protein